MAWTISPALRAPFVDLFKLYADQSTVAKFRQGAHQLRATHFKLDPLV